MNARIYWTLIAYALFSRIMLADWSGWMDALSSVAWIGGTVYLCYNMQWSAYRKRIKDIGLVMKKGKDGKNHAELELQYEERDAVADVGFWLVWLFLLFILDVFHLTVWLLLVVLAAVLIIAAFFCIGYVANNVRPAYNYARQWLVWARARLRYWYESTFRSSSK